MKQWDVWLFLFLERGNVFVDLWMLRKIEIYMRQLFLLMIMFLALNKCGLFSQEIGQSSKEIKQIIKYTTQLRTGYDTNGNSKGNNVTWDVKYYDGQIVYVIQCYVNQYLLDFGIITNLCKQYVMEDGKLAYILTQYEKLSLKKLKEVYDKSYGENKIGNIYFTEDTTHFRKLYLNSNGLATAEYRKTEISKLPNDVQKIIKEQELKKRKQQAERKRQREKEMKLQLIEDEKRRKKEEEERLIQLKKNKDDFLSLVDNLNYYFEFEFLSIKPEIEFDDLICDGIKDIVPTKNKRKTIIFDIYFDGKGKAIKIKHPVYDLSPLLSYVSLDGKAVATEQDVTRQVQFKTRDSISIQHSNIRAIINAPNNKGLPLIERTHTFCSECSINAKSNVTVEGWIINELRTAKGKYFEMDFSILRIVQGVEEKEWVEFLSVRKVKKSKDFLELLSGIDEIK